MVVYSIVYLTILEDKLSGCVDVVWSWQVLKAAAKQSCLWRRVCLQNCFSESFCRDGWWDLLSHPTLTISDHWKVCRHRATLWSRPHPPHRRRRWARAGRWPGCRHTGPSPRPSSWRPGRSRAAPRGRFCLLLRPSTVMFDRKISWHHHVK